MFRAADPEGNSIHSCHAGRGPSLVGGARPGLPKRSALRTIVFHGDRDLTVNSVNGDRVIARRILWRIFVFLSAKESREAPPTAHTNASGNEVLEQWVVHGLGYAWSGGSAAGSYTDACEPDARREIVRFFFRKPSA
jgi:poly(3-hydroxybutyrate) depolymerase